MYHELHVDTGSTIMTMSVCSVNKEDLSNYRPMSNLSFLPFDFLPIDFLPFRIESDRNCPIRIESRSFAGPCYITFYFLYVFIMCCHCT